MTKTLVGTGKCPRCGGESRVYQVENFPFPDDQQRWWEEECDCGLRLERNRISSNTTTSEIWVWEEEQRRQHIKAVMATLPFPPGDGEDPTVVKEKVRQAIAQLPKADFPYLYLAIGEHRTREASWYEQDARSWLPFPFAGDESPGMVDYRDNELRQSRISEAACMRRIEQIIAILREIEREKR